MSLDGVVAKKLARKPLADLLEMSPSVLIGLTASTAKVLADTLHIHTVRCVPASSLARGRCLGWRACPHAQPGTPPVQCHQASATQLHLQQWERR
jgi:hypothetical protein